MNSFIVLVFSVLMLKGSLGAILLDITCDDVLTFYADNTEIVNASTPGYGIWDATKRVSVPSNTQVYGIKCVNTGGPGGILAASSYGTFTDSGWRCTSRVPRVGWLSRGYDDSAWAPANSIAKNDGSRWRVIRGMPRRAEWIWTRNGQQDTTVYCRTERGIQGEVMVDLTCDNKVSFYADDKTLVDDSTAGNGIFSSVQHVAVPISTEVYGLKCVNTGGPGGIVASFSDGSVTDGSWRCTNTTPGARWMNANYEDNWWDEANIIQKNNVNTVWAKLPGISSQAEWIWTKVWDGTPTTVYCRNEKATIAARISADIACDDVLTFYADRQALVDPSTAGYDEWNKIHHVTIPQGTKVYGIKCVNKGGPGGIAASFSDGTVTDGRWKCTNVNPGGAWLNENYDDSTWSSAYSIQSNGDYFPWRGFFDVASYAEWIWTTGWNNQDGTVYCRIRVAGNN